MNSESQPTPANRCPALKALAEACQLGACNPYALISSLAKALPELRPFEVKEHPAVKIVLGHLSYLCGEALGPSTKAMAEFDAWRLK